MTNETGSRRAYERHTIEFEVEVSALDGAQREFMEMAVLRDVSGGGACFISTRPELYSEGQRLALAIYLPGTDQLDARMQGDATVVWIGAPDDAAPGGMPRTSIGVCMDDLMTFEHIMQNMESPDASEQDAAT